VKQELSNFKFYNGVVIYPLFFFLSIWIVFWVEIKFGLDFTSWGVRPRTLFGLRGILFSPFIHSGLNHLWHNSMPLLILTAALFYFYKRISWKVLFWLLILSGFGTWLIGRSSFHIGMSGVIYALVSFLFFKGIFARYFRLIALSLLVVFLYGSLIWGTLPLNETVSWEGHLSGFIAGFLLSLRFRESIPKTIPYHWEDKDYNEEEDPFMKQFDENGYFFELPSNDNLIDEESEKDNSLQRVNYTYVYTYKEEEE